MKDEQKPKPVASERLECWADGDSIQIVAVTSTGDPVDCSREEAQAFALKILDAVRQA